MMGQPPTTLLLALLLLLLLGAPPPAAAAPVVDDDVMAAMQDWRDSTEMSREEFAAKYASRLTIEAGVLFGKLDANGDGQLSGKEIQLGANNLEAGLRKPDGGEAAAAAAAAGMDFETFSKLLAMDTHRPRDAGALFVKMYAAPALSAETLALTLACAGTLTRTARSRRRSSRRGKRI